MLLRKMLFLQRHAPAEGTGHGPIYEEKHAYWMRSDSAAYLEANDIAVAAPEDMAAENDDRRPTPLKASLINIVRAGPTMRRVLIGGVPYTKEPVSNHVAERIRKDLIDGRIELPNEIAEVVTGKKPAPPPPAAPTVEEPAPTEPDTPEPAPVEEDDLQEDEVEQDPADLAVDGQDDPSAERGEEGEVAHPGPVGVPGRTIEEQQAAEDGADDNEAEAPAAAQLGYSAAHAGRGRYRVVDSEGEPIDEELMSKEEAEAAAARLTEAKTD